MALTTIGSQSGSDLVRSSSPTLGWGDGVQAASRRVEAARGLVSGELERAQARGALVDVPVTSLGADSATAGVARAYEDARSLSLRPAPSREGGLRADSPLPSASGEGDPSPQGPARGAAWEATRHWGDGARRTASRAVRGVRNATLRASDDAGSVDPHDAGAQAQGTLGEAGRATGRLGGAAAGGAGRLGDVAGGAVRTAAGGPSASPLARAQRRMAQARSRARLARGATRSSGTAAAAGATTVMAPIRLLGHVGGGMLAALVSSVATPIAVTVALVVAIAIAGATTGAASQERPRFGGGYQAIVAAARAWLASGSTYLLGGHPSQVGDPTDCSGLVMHCYAQAGVTLSHSSWDIHNDSRFEQVSPEDAIPGDVLWWPGHVAIYIGNGELIEHAGPKGAPVTSGPVWGSPIYLHFPGLVSGTIIEVPEYYNGVRLGTLATRFGPVLFGQSRAAPEGQFEEYFASHGGTYDARGFGVLDGRYVVCMTSTFGNVFDWVTVYFDDGSSIECVIGTEKSQTYAPWDDNPANMWGHQQGAGILEFEGLDSIGDDPYYALGIHGLRVVAVQNNGPIV